MTPNRIRPLGLLLALPLWLGGCLLPQPDTPPIPPMAQAPGRSGAPAKAPAAQPSASTAASEPVSNNGGGLVAGSDRVMPTAAPLPAAAGMAGAGAAGGQPDQGFVGGASDGTTAAMAPAAPNAGASAAPGTEAQASPAPGRLDVTLKGDTVSQVWVVPSGGGPGAGTPVQEGHFTLDLPAGEYYLELTVGEKRLRTTKPVAVWAGGVRLLEVTVAAGAITIAESVPLEDTSPSPTPDPSPQIVKFY